MKPLFRSQMTVERRPRLRPRVRVALPIAGLLLFVGSGALPCHWTAPAAAQGSAARDVPLRLTEWSLTPSQVTVPAGRPVRFAASNNGALPHSIAVEGPGIYAESEAAGSDQVTYLELTFQLPGRYDIYCPINAGQHRALGQEGVVNVVAAGPTALLPRTGDAPPGDDSPIAGADPPPDHHGEAN